MTTISHNKVLKNYLLNHFCPSQLWSPQKTGMKHQPGDKHVMNKPDLGFDLVSLGLTRWGQK